MKFRDIYASYMGEVRRADSLWTLFWSVWPRPIGIMPIAYWLPRIFR